MKLRIKGNTIRLRLTQSEVVRLAAEGAVREAVSFGDMTLGYEIRSVEDAESLAADFDGASIVVVVPKKEVDEWESTDAVAIEYGGKPDVLIEKDFQCLSARKNEDESDAFPNPQKEC